MDLLDRGDIKLDAVEFVVIDEADRMADMGFLPEVRKILDLTPDDRQTLLFSATLDGDIDVLVRNYQNNPARHELAVDPADGAKVTHLFWNVGPRPARVAVRQGHLLGRPDHRVLPHQARRRSRRPPARADRPPRRRHPRRPLAGPARAGPRVVPPRLRSTPSSPPTSPPAASTSTASSAVVHLDPPADEKDYVHRSGRTGRAGAEGVVVTFVAPELRKDVTKMQKILKMTPGITSPDADGLPVLERPARKIRATPPRDDDAPRAARPGGPRTSRRTGAPRRGYASDGPAAATTTSQRPSVPPVPPVRLALVEPAVRA